ncbi:MAG TPA: AMP-binding protein, partial [Trebonia sp.]|nr:AMP-binding protein [Trebonia sp.]
VREERIDVVSAVPAVYWQLLHGTGIEPADTAGVRWVIFGGAATPPSQVRLLADAFPNATMNSGYGLTETSGGMTGLPPEVALDIPDSVGLALPNVDIALRGPEAADGRGELLIRSAQVMAGYWQRPDDTAATFADGWFCTGDAATVDADGYIRIVDRIKDTINRGGENVYCLEVERALLAHPGVGEAAVVGVPDPMMGEKVGAVVVRAAGASVTATELAAFTAGRIADFKVPQYVVFSEQPLPRNAMGKVDKRALRGRDDWGAPLR